jgi:hypothetical protein
MYQANLQVGANNSLALAMLASLSKNSQQAQPM